MTTATTKTKDKVYSYSRLNTFEGCQRQFYHKYVEGRPIPGNLPMQVGKIFHLAIEMVISEGYSPEEAVLYASYAEGGLPEGERDQQIIKMVKKAYRRLKQFQNEHTDMISELHLKLETEEGYIQGYLDIVLDNPMMDELLIMDFKTSWQSYAADTKQLALYAYLFREMRNGFIPNTFKGRLIFPRLSEKDDSEVVFTDELLDEAYLWSQDMIRQIENKDASSIDEWKMTSDRVKCQYCSFASLCSGGMVDNLPSDGTPKDDEEASRIGEYIIMQEQSIKNMKDGLKKYAKDNKKAIPVNGGSWEHVKSEPNPKIDFLTLQEFAKEHDLDIDDLIKYDNKKLKKLIDGDESGKLKNKVEWTKPRSTFKFVGGKK
ncbi:CRISPR/Cas system-associated exonuclease Cas4 (RecB family) [Evansella vedderi]|uniref:CRISPR/Cas system-associated exonuclease Cas4 (RecB family) n=1 Tax=Evansella vedderi TaxID=38282 RepID=A0ABT9ZWC3_9BACI|nr:PD-(D/E)XK nuclease family protein [Evansella vedderi]MDQ0255531.1 CRISPR/Cas system-associated exonuclease Cas4 (RecB family) [Evansella vedderi]